MRRFFFLVSFLLLSLPIFSQSSEILKEQAILYREKGYDLYSRGDLREALTFYRKAVQLDPYFSEAYSEMGIILEALGDEENAILMYEAAVELNPAYAPTYTNLALFYEERNDIEKARFYWKERYRLGKSGEYWEKEAWKHLIALGITSEGKKELLDEKFAQGYEEGSSQRGQEWLQTIELAKEHFERGDIFLSLGAYEKAANEFQTALSLNPPDKILFMKISEHYIQAKWHLKSEAVKSYINAALASLDKKAYKGAVQKLEKALSELTNIQE